MIGKSRIRIHPCMTCTSRCQCRIMLIHNPMVDRYMIHMQGLDTIRLSMELSILVPRWAELPTRTQNHTSHNKTPNNMSRSFNGCMDSNSRRHSVYNQTNKVCNTSLSQVRNHLHTKCKSLLNTNLCLCFDNFKATKRSYSRGGYDHFDIVNIRCNYRCQISNIRRTGYPQACFRTSCTNLLKHQLYHSSWVYFDSRRLSQGTRRHRMSSCMFYPGEDKHLHYTFCSHPLCIQHNQKSNRRRLYCRHDIKYQYKEVHKYRQQEVRSQLHTQCKPQSDQCKHYSLTSNRHMSSCYRYTVRQCKWMKSRSARQAR